MWKQEIFSPGLNVLKVHQVKWAVSSCRYSERSNTKCVGITIETRPDYCLKRHLSDMLSYGCTRLEIGVQSVYEDVARDTNRLVSLQKQTEIGNHDIKTFLKSNKHSFCHHNAVWIVFFNVFFPPEDTRCELCVSLFNWQRMLALKWSPTWCQTCRMWTWRGTWSSSL